MPRKSFIPENDVVIEDNELNQRHFTPEGDYEIPTSMEELLQECGLTFEDYYRNEYE